LDGFLRWVSFALIALVVGCALCVAAARTLDPRAAGVAGMLAFGFGVVGTLALLSLARAALQRLFGVPADEYGPYPDDRDAFERHRRKFRRVRRNLAERWTVQRQLREALRKALEAGELERAARWKSKAEEVWMECQARFRRIPRRERQALDARIARDVEEFATVKYINAAKKHLERVPELKTERGREQLRAKARALVEQGQADAAANGERLAAFAREQRLYWSPLAAEPDPAPAALDPRAPRGQPARWVPLGQAVEVGGFRVPGGLYVGEVLAALDDPFDTDPALIDPRARIAARPDPSERSLRGIVCWAGWSPGARAGYLDWLTEGKRADGAPDDFVWLYLYGLERRLLVDAERDPQARREVAGLWTELERLCARFGDRPALARALRELSGFVALRHPGELPEGPPQHADGPPGELTGRLAVGLARFVARGAPLPVTWARAWLHALTGGRLRAPARRCPEEFELLFRERYAQRHGAGLVAAPGPDRLARSYRPVNPALDVGPREAALELPDPAQCAASAQALAALADSCCAELSTLSRFVSTAGDGARADLKVLASLPREVLELRDDPDLGVLRGLLAETAEELDASGRAWLSVERLARLWPVKRECAPTKTDCAAFARLLGHLGWCVEPDPRFDGDTWRAGQRVALYPAHADAAQAPTRTYRAAATVLRIAAAVTTADGAASGGEEAELRAHLEEVLELEPGERTRLGAHLAWLLEHPPRLGRLEKRAAELGPVRCERVARFLLQLACANGVVTPGELHILEKAYRLLDLDPARVHADLHQATSGSRGGAAAGRVALDPDLLRRKLAETAVVSSLLDDIFQDEEPAAAAARAAPAAAAPRAHAGLDAPHSALLEALAARGSWSRDEVEDLAQGLGLLVDGALDALNDAAFEALGEPVWEGDDPLEVFRDVAAGLIE
jgi:hypothetical protein